MTMYDDDEDDFIDEENPEWTEERFKNVLTFEQMPPELQALVLASRERNAKKAQEQKVRVTIPYSQKVINAFKATGKGWQGRMNQALEEYVAAKAL